MPIKDSIQEKSNFPDGFRWGVAASALQIEGATREDGRGESIWERFARIPGAIADGSTPAVATDHYYRNEEDVRLLKKLGVNAYRFSLSWPRIFPEGTGRINQQGLDYYRHELTALREADIEPWVTLYWWDMPQALEDRGGWLNRDSADWFAAYADTVTRELGDLLGPITTINEPSSILHGYYPGTDAPGRNSFPDALQAAHHLLLGHGKAVEAIRANMGDDAQVGIALGVVPVRPLNPGSEKDSDAAQRYDGYHNRLWLDPLYCGHYPEDMLEVFGADAPKTFAEDFDVIKSPIDFLGLNYYDPYYIRHEDNDNPLKFARSIEGVLHLNQTELGWVIDENGLAEVIDRVRNEYHVPQIIISENGAASNKESIHAGRVHDQQRINYLKKHLGILETAVKNGAPIAGYFLWSFLDNWEWPQGYVPRFGVVYVDYDTLERTVKDSGYFYRDFIWEHTHRLSLAF